MSADSPARTGTGVGVRTSYGGSVTGSSSPVCVTPQPVTDKSFIDSVTGFINEVVPTSYATTTNESKEQVQWARFEYADINSSTLSASHETDSSVTPPLLLVLGYTSGIQVWSIPANGEATEVLSWRQGNVRVLRILPTPDSSNNVEDLFSHKRPLMALCDTIAPGPHFCSLGFISLRDGDQVKSIQFKSPIIDVHSNKSSVIVTFSERIAIFDACTLEDRMTVTTCYQSPGLCPNPVALGARWLAYAERQMIPAWRSSGGCEGEGVASYTATVIHAAKSLGKGLRELGESVANSLTGVTTPQYPPTAGVIPGDQNTPGVVTILDIQSTMDQNDGSTYISSSNSKTFPLESVLAHFIAHSEPIVALSFDPTGLLLLTADKRGHDFHLFKIHPHPCGPSLAAVHHLYVLHRGDTTAKVQDISFSWDSRWVAVSTLRGTTHVFPVTPYGGPVGVRTHATPHVVNRLSRFHRSAGLSADGRSNSPVFLNEIPSAVPFSNPRLPPFPHPTIVYPLAQIRQPAQFGPGNISLQTNVRSSTSRQRLSSASEDAPNLKLCAAFAAPRAWLLEPRESRIRNHRHTTDSLFIMACHGSLIQYDLDPKHATNIPREKVCDESTIELAVEAKARWTLLRQLQSMEIQSPLAVDNPLLCNKFKNSLQNQKSEDEDRWLSQVEIITHAGPHRRLWMGPQFMFKTYNSSSAVPLATTDIEAVEIGTGTAVRPARSTPVNMPRVGTRPLVPVLIESTSASSYEQSPRLLEMHRNTRRDSDSSIGAGDTQLREDLADAMMESPGLSIREQGYGMGHVIAQIKHPSSQPSATTIVKVVNPLGTVITLPSDEEAEYPVCLDSTEYVIHENCDETLFRPIVGASNTTLSRNNILVIAGRPETSSPTATSTNLYDTVPSPSLSDSEQYYLPPETIIPCTVEKKSVGHYSKQPQRVCDNKSVTSSPLSITTYETTVAPDGKCIRNQSPSPKPIDSSKISTETIERSKKIESDYYTEEKMKDVVKKTKDLSLKTSSKLDKKLKKDDSTKVSKVEKKYSTSATVEITEEIPKSDEKADISLEEEVKTSVTRKVWGQIESHSDNTTMCSNLFPSLPTQKSEIISKKYDDSSENSDKKCKFDVEKSSKVKNSSSYAKITTEISLRPYDIDSNIETSEPISKYKKKTKNLSEIDTPSKTIPEIDTNIETSEPISKYKKKIAKNLSEIVTPSKTVPDIDSNIETSEPISKYNKKAWKNLEEIEIPSKIFPDFESNVETVAKGWKNVENTEENIEVIESTSKTKSKPWKNIELSIGTVKPVLYPRKRIRKNIEDVEIPPPSIEIVETTSKNKKKAWKTVEEIEVSPIESKVEIVDPITKIKKKTWKTLEEIEMPKPSVESTVEIVEPITKSKKKAWKNLEDIEKIDVDPYNIEIVESTVRNRKKSSKNFEETEIVSITTTEMEDESNVEIVEVKPKKKLSKNLEEFEYLDIKVDDSKTQDSDENYVEAENCGLQIGQTCKQLDVKKKSVRKTKTKKVKNTDDDFTEIIAIETSSKDDLDNDEFLSLEPEYEKADFSFDITYPDDDIIPIENPQSESDDSSCKLVVKGEDSEEIEPLISLITTGGATIDSSHEDNTRDDGEIEGENNSAIGTSSGGIAQKTTYKRKSKKKRR